MQNVELHIEPKTPPLSAEQFYRDLPPFAITLDGYVAAGPLFDPRGPRVNFNHHEQVSRLETRATCAQVLIAIRQGLYKTFQQAGRKRAEIFVNDCDEDVALSTFLLMHPQLVEQVMNPRINRLVAMEDMLDTTAGAYPFPSDLESVEELAWVFEPYRRFRLSGGVERKDAQEFGSIMSDVHYRILSYVCGSPGRVVLDTNYEVIGRGTGWCMVKELGLHARTGMFADGIHAFVSVRPRPDGRYTYTIGKMSQFIPCPLADILFQLNELENGGDDRWGGSPDMVIGSPRVSGSWLTPDTISQTVESCVQARLRAGQA